MIDFGIVIIFSSFPHKIKRGKIESGKEAMELMKCQTCVPNIIRKERENVKIKDNNWSNTRLAVIGEENFTANLFAKGVNKNGRIFKNEKVGYSNSSCTVTSIETPTHVWQENL